MNLLNLRKKLVEETGRYDLVVDTTTWADNGANYYIQRGLRILEQRLAFPESMYKQVLPVLAGQQVFLYSPARDLRKVTFASFGVSYLLSYGVSEFSNEAGVPTSYESIPTQTIPEMNLLNICDLDMPADGVDVMLESVQGKRAIKLNCPTQENGTLIMYGSYYNTLPTLDTDENFWMLTYPNLCVWAAAYNIEVSYRNQTGADAWMQNIMSELQWIDKDFASQEWSNQT